MSKQPISRDAWDTIWLTAALLFLALAATTLLPATGDKINDLGYSSLCPFAPYSTLALLVVAGVAWMIRMYIRGQKPS